MSANLDEFQLIQQFFAAQSHDDPLLTTGIGDDCAVLTVPQGTQLAVSTDTLVEGTHFFADISATDLAVKSLAVNLSDLAACGAIPKWITLALTLPKTDVEWLSEFSQALFQQLTVYGVTLIGGDTTRGPLSITITAFGLVPVQQAITRSTAAVGDYIYVSGYLGDSAAGCELCATASNHSQYSIIEHSLLMRHLRPEPRIAQGVALRRYASAMLDLSDGLAGDIRHILTASGCGATIELTQLPLSPELLTFAGAARARQLALTGGEDYELCFTVPPAKRDSFEAEFIQQGWRFYAIGRITEYPEQLCFTERGVPLLLEVTGFDHFKSSL